MTFKIKYLGILALFFGFSLTLSAQEGKVTVDQDADIDKLLEYKKDVTTSAVYKIQVFDSTDPDKAEREKSNFLNAYNDWPVQIVWNTPNYKVWVGNFATRLEADRALVKIKKKYMYANVLQPRTRD